MGKEAAGAEQQCRLDEAAEEADAASMQALREEEEEVEAAQRPLWDEVGRDGRVEAALAKPDPTANAPKEAERAERVVRRAVRRTVLQNRISSLPRLMMRLHPLVWRVLIPRMRQQQRLRLRHREIQLRRKWRMRRPSLLRRRMRKQPKVRLR